MFTTEYHNQKQNNYISEIYTIRNIIIKLLLIASTNSWELINTCRHHHYHISHLYVVNKFTCHKSSHNVYTFCNLKYKCNSILKVSIYLPIQIVQVGCFPRTSQTYSLPLSSWQHSQYADLRIQKCRSALLFVESQIHWLQHCIISKLRTFALVIGLLT